jgi:hypothetical protein
LHGLADVLRSGIETCGDELHSSVFPELGSLIEFICPSMNDVLVIEVIHGSHDAMLEFLFQCDADVAQDRAGEVGEEAFDEVEPGAVLGHKGEFENGRPVGWRASLCLFGDMRGMIVKDHSVTGTGDVEKLRNAMNSRLR